MTDQKSMADILAENRAQGTVGSSARALFPSRPLPTWASLRLTWPVRLLCLFLAFHCVSLYMIWHPILVERPYAVTDHAPALLAAALNFFLLVGTASVIQSRLHAAELVRYGPVVIMVLALFLNPMVFGVCVPVYTLIRVAQVRRRLEAVP